MTTEYGQIIGYVNQTEQPHGMYAKIPSEEGGTLRQCRNRRTATSGAMTGPGTMILPYGAGGEPGRGEIPMSAAKQAGG